MSSVVRKPAFCICENKDVDQLRGNHEADHKLNVVAQKRSGRPRKSWNEVMKNDRKKLDMDSADLQNRSEWRGRLQGRLVKKPN